MATNAELQARVEELEAAQARAEMINQISQGLNSARDEQELLQSLSLPFLQAGTFARSLVYIDSEAGEPEWAEVVATWRREGASPTPVGTRYRLAEFPLARLLLASPDAPLLLANIGADERVGASSREVMAHMGIQAMAFIPLTMAGPGRDPLIKRRWVGFIILDWDQPHTFSEQEVEAYHALMDLVAPVVANRRLLVERERAVVETLYQISRDLNTTFNKDELLQALAQPAIQAGAARVSLLYIDPDQSGKPEWAEVATAWQEEGLAPVVPIGMRYRLAEFPSMHQLLNNPHESLLISDAATDERVDETTKSIMAQMDICAMAFIPLTQAGLDHERSEERRWVGLLNFNWSQAHEFSREEAEIYQALVGLAAPAVESRRLVDGLEHMVQERTLELQRLLDNIRDAVISTDLKGTILSWNQASEDIYGWTAEEVIGKNISLVYKQEDWSILAEEIIRPTLEKGYQQGEYRAVRKDGTDMIGRMVTSLVRDDEDLPIGMAGIVSDITEEREAAAEHERLQQQLIAAQQQAILELSTPIIPLIDRIIVMPLVGSIDSMRARHIMRALLQGIREHRAKVLILDITGVPIVDSGVANHLDKTIQAARLKGARTIITGLSDAVAEAIVDLGIDWSELDTLANLRTGLVVALNSLGIELNKT